MGNWTFYDDHLLLPQQAVQQDRLSPTSTLKQKYIETKIYYIYSTANKSNFLKNLGHDESQWNVSHTVNRNADRS